MYEVIPMYARTNLFVKHDKFLLIYYVHVPMKYVKEEKKQIREKERENNKIKLKQSQKVQSINKKRYYRKILHQRGKTIEC